MPNGCLSYFRQVIVSPKRNLNLLEYQSKSLLQESGVAIQEFRVLEGKHDAKNLADFSKSAVAWCNEWHPHKMHVFWIITDVPEYVVKAQILAGGRGKGHFDNGFKGGVHITKK